MFKPEQKKHKCTLKAESNYLLKDVRNSWRRWIVVDPRSKLSLNILKSKAAAKAEIVRHVYYFRGTIHPLSKLRSVWETVMILVFFIFFICAPINVVFIYGLRKNVYNYRTYGMIEFILDIFFITDIVMNFYTGFIDTNTGRIVLDRKKIAIRYLKFMFWMDLISSFPLNLLVKTPDTPTIKEEEATLYDCMDFHTYYDSCLIDFLDMVQLIKFIRFPTVISHVDNFTKRHNLRFFYMKIFKLVCFIFFTIHSCTWLQFLIERLMHGTHHQSDDGDSTLWGTEQVQGDWSSQYAGELYLHSLYRAFAFVGGFGLEIAHKKQSDVRAQVLIIIFCIVGFVIRNYIIAQGYMLVKIIYSSSMEFQQNRYQLKEYMHAIQLPADIQSRVLSYYDFRLQKQLYNESNINEIIGQKLFEEARFEQSKRLLKQVSFMMMMPHELLVQIAGVLQMETYLRNDVVVSGGQDEEAMYFVLSGTLAVFHHTTGEELEHFEDGAYFGEMSLFELPEITNFTVAIETTEVYVLHVNDFLEIMSNYPDLYERAKNVAISKLNVNTIIEELIDNVIQPTNLSQGSSTLTYFF